MLLIFLLCNMLLHTMTFFAYSLHFFSFLSFYVYISSGKGPPPNNVPNENGVDF